MTETPSSESAESTPTATSPTERIAALLETLPLNRARVALWLVAFALITVLVYVSWRYVGTLVIGMFVYYVTRPVFRRIHVRIESRTLAVVTSLLAIALPVLVLIGWALAILVSSLGGFLNSDASGDLEGIVEPYLDFTSTIAQLEGLVTDLLADPSGLTELQIGPLLGQLVDPLLSAVGLVFNAGIHGFIVLILVFYLLRDDYRIAHWSHNTFLTEGSVFDSYLKTVDRDLHNVYFGNILNALMTGLLAAVVYSVLNLFAPAAVKVPQAAFLGLLVGAASLVPVIGIKLVTWPVGAYLLGRALWFDPQSLWFPVLFLLVSFVIVDYIPDQLLRPYVSGRTLHVGAVMLAYTIGPLLFGWYGIFLAPLLFVLIFEFGRLVFPWLINPESVLDSPSGPPVEDEDSETVDVTPTPSTSDERLPDTSDDPRLPGPTERRDIGGGGE